MCESPSAIVVSSPPSSVSESGWWFIQDRLRLVGERMLSPGVHEVSVSFSLVIPYLQVGPSGPLTLPFGALASLETDAAASVSPHSPLRDRTNAPISDPAPAAVRTRENDPISAQSQIPWTLGASAFNWTPEVIRAERPAPDIAVGIVASGVATVIELEPGQLWRSYPESTDAEVDALRSSLDAAGGAVSIVGGESRRLAPLRAAPIRGRAPRVPAPAASRRAPGRRPRCQAAHRAGGRAASAARAPDPARPRPRALRRDPGPADPGFARHVRPSIDTIAAIDDERVRLLVDISMLMPALPPTYLERLRAGGVDSCTARPAHLRLARTRDPRRGRRLSALGRGAAGRAHDVHEPADPVRTIGCRGTSAASSRSSGAFHLKFWDLDDTDGRVSAPIRDLGVELERSGFSGPLTSEWGGHEWLDSDPADMTRAHLELARAALGAGALQAARVAGRAG